MKCRMIAATAVCLLLTGCSSAGGGDAKPATSTTGTPAQRAAKLSGEWIPKLEKATSSKVSAVCKDVGSTRCADHLTRISSTVYDLETAIEGAGATKLYPRSMREIRKLDKATAAYTDDGCLRDPNAGIDGSPCPGAAYDIMGAGASLQFTLLTDELKRKSNS